MDDLVYGLAASGIAVAIGPLMVRRIGISIARSAERRAIERARPVGGTEASWAALYPSAVVGLVVAMSLPALQGLPKSQRELIQGLAFGLFGAFALLVLLLHSMPNQRRASKYNALIVAGIAWQLAQSIKSRWTFVTPIEFGWQYAFLMVLGPAVHRMLRPSQAIHWLNSSWLLRTYRLVMLLRGAGPLSFVVFAALSLLIPGFTVVYLTVRFLLLEKLFQTPVLYLRSFAEPDANDSFSKVLTPAVVSYLPLTGLVNQAQTGGSLNDRVHYAWRSRFHAVPDAFWQDWVLRQLPAAAGAIIDARTGTAGVVWELQAALRHMQRERVLLLLDDTQTTLPDGSALPSGVDVLRIPASVSKDQRRTIERELRGQVREWMQGRLIPSLTERHFVEPGWLRVVQPPVGPGFGPTALAYLVLLPAWITTTVYVYNFQNRLDSLRSAYVMQAQAETRFAQEELRFRARRYYGEYHTCPSVKTLCDHHELPPSACVNPSTEPIDCVPTRPSTQATPSKGSTDQLRPKCFCPPGDPLCSCL
jgi:hypothetical protein